MPEICLNIFVDVSMNKAISRTELTFGVEGICTPQCWVGIIQFTEDLTEQKDEERDNLPALPCHLSWTSVSNNCVSQSLTLYII